MNKVLGDIYYSYKNKCIILVYRYFYHLYTPIIFLHYSYQNPTLFPPINIQAQASGKQALQGNLTDSLTPPHPIPENASLENSLENLAVRSLLSDAKI